jgi:hypothetical protein
MLRIVEYTLLAVSLLVVLGLIVSGSKNSSDSSGAQPPTLDDGPDAQEHGKAV